MTDQTQDFRSTAQRLLDEYKAITGVAEPARPEEISFNQAKTAQQDVLRKALNTQGARFRDARTFWANDDQPETEQNIRIVAFTDDSALQWNIFPRGRENVRLNHDPNPMGIH